MNNSENIPEDLERDIPKVLPVLPGKLRSKEEFVNLIVQLYKICTTREVTINGTVERSIHMKFIGYAANLAGIKRIFPDIKPNLTGLHRVLLTVEAAATSYRTRHVAVAVVGKFDNGVINDELIAACAAEGEDTTVQEYLYTLFVERFLPLCMKALMFSHKKARLAIEAYYTIELVKIETDQLKNDYHLMLTSLKNRASVNCLMVTVMAYKKKAIETLQSYAAFWDGDAFKWVRCILKSLHFHESISEDLSDLKEWIDQRKITENIVKAEMHRIGTLSVFKAITEELDPIINGVRSFTPTPLEIAKEKAALIKNPVSRIKRESEEFFRPEAERSIGKAKSLLEQIKSIRGTIDNLLLSGLEINHENVGLTQDEIEDYYVRISNTLAQKEYEIKVNEAKQKAINDELAKGAPQLELPPLKGFSSWLNFRKAINEIMPLHENNLIKKQILLKALKNSEDLIRCQSMDYEDGFKYLVQRYESSALIPGLIDELLKLSPASTDRQAYENLTQLISTTSMLKSYEQIDKLDSNCRSKLTYILLHRDFQLDFLYQQVIYEESIKKDVPEERMLDAISEITCLQTAEIENNRRVWWLEMMGRYLIVARELMKTSKEKKEKSQTIESFSTGTDEVETIDSCPVCNDVHLFMGKAMVSLTKCPIFTSQEYSVDKRREIVKKFGFCIRCLWKMNNPRCANCTPLPHYLLKEKHEDSAESNEDDSEAEDNSKSNIEQSGEEDDKDE